MSKLATHTRIDLACILIGLVLFATVPLLAHNAAHLSTCPPSEPSPTCIVTITTTVAHLSGSPSQSAGLQITTSDPALTPFVIPSGLLHTTVHAGDKLSVRTIGNRIVRATIGGSTIPIGAPLTSSTYGRLLLIAILLLFGGLYDLSHRRRKAHLKKTSNATA